MIRVKDMPRMIFQTRKALTSDDWDKSYKDVFIPSSIKVEKLQTISKSKKEDKVTDIEAFTKKKAEETIKEKRRKEHFFHGAISFPR